MGIHKDYVMDLENPHMSYFRKKINSSNILTKLGLEKGKYILSTIHRPVNVDIKESFSNIDLDENDDRS